MFTRNLMNTAFSSYLDILDFVRYIDYYEAHVIDRLGCPILDHTAQCNQGSDKNNANILG